MYYEINVTHNARHLFATAERSITDCYQLGRVYAELKNRFPESEGFGITVRECYEMSAPVDPNKIKL